MKQYTQSSERVIHDGCVINDVIVYAVLAFPDRDTWYGDLVERAIPAMGEKYMKLFINCKFHPFLFLMIAQDMQNGD